MYTPLVSCIQVLVKFETFSNFLLIVELRQWIGIVAFGMLMGMIEICVGHFGISFPPIFMLFGWNVSRFSLVADSESSATGSDLGVSDI